MQGHMIGGCSTRKELAEFSQRAVLGRSPVSSGESQLLWEMASEGGTEGWIRWLSREGKACSTKLAPRGVTPVGAVSRVAAATRGLLQSLREAAHAARPSRPHEVCVHVSGSSWTEGAQGWGQE